MTKQAALDQEKGQNSNDLIMITGVFFFGNKIKALMAKGLLDYLFPVDQMKNCSLRMAMNIIIPGFIILFSIFSNLKHFYRYSQQRIKLLNIGQIDG